MQVLPHTLNIPAEPESINPLLSLLREVCRVAGSNSIRLQCVLPDSGSLSSQWSIVSGDPHVVGATALGCLNESSPHARAILIVGKFHVSLRATSSGYTATVTEGTEEIESHELELETPSRTPGISSGIPLGDVIDSLAKSSPAEASPFGQFRNEVGRHTGDEVPDDDRMIDSHDTRP